jgi:GT2 family glycosyltransferase
LGGTAAGVLQEGRVNPSQPNPERVTVVIPTYNRSASLSRCLNALASSELPGIEADVVVVDDGSTDETAKVVQALAVGQTSGMRFRLLRQQNGGPSAARNLGIAASETELVLFTDDDCVPGPAWISTLARSPWSEDTGGIGGRIECAESRTWVSRYCRYMRYNEYPAPHRPWNFLNTANCAYPRRVLEEVGGFVEGLRGGEDVELSWRILTAGYRLRYHPGAVVEHYHREALRPLLRTFWSRGYNGIRRDLLWNPGCDVSRSRRNREALRQLTWAAEAMLIMPRAASLFRRGVPAADAVPFALVDWLRPGMNRAGKIAMLNRLLRGEEPLRSQQAVEGRTPDPAPPDPIPLTNP